MRFYRNKIWSRILFRHCVIVCNLYDWIIKNNINFFFFEVLGNNGPSSQRLLHTFLTCMNSTGSENMSNYNNNKKTALKSGWVETLILKCIDNNILTTPSVFFWNICYLFENCKKKGIC